MVCIKPNANTRSVRDLVHDTLLDFINPLDDGGGRIVNEYDLSCLMLDGESSRVSMGELVDHQYGELAKYAMHTSGQSVKIPSEEFQKAFGEELQVVKEEKRIYSAREALSALGCDPATLESAWREAEQDSSKGKIHSFGKNFHCANLAIHGKNVYVINGFYMAVRGEYLQPDRPIHCLIIKWNKENLSWSEFLSKVIGGEDPAVAEAGSLRHTIFSKYEEFGLESAPTKVFNAIHASASPLEGLAERMNWCSRQINADDYGRILLGRGIPESRILDWVSGEAVVDAKDESKTTCVFDIVKGMDSKECTEKLTELYDYELFGTSLKKEGRCNPAQTNCCTIS